MLSHYRQYFARAFRSKQNDTSELDIADADGEQDIDDEEKVVSSDKSRVLGYVVSDRRA